MTPNFKKEEFTCKCGCGFNDIDLGLVNRLQVVRDIARIPIRIRSACRCTKHNADVGGAIEGYHPKGKAVDWDFYESEINSLGMTLLEKICTKLLDNWSGGFHYYPTNEKGIEFCHCDVGPRRRW